MMTNVSLISALPTSAQQEYNTLRNDVWNSRTDWSYCLTKTLQPLVISSFICVVCLFGFVGNGTVIWLLGFCMKRNRFTTYILNLAVADLGVLISLISIAVSFIVRNDDKITSTLEYLSVGVVLYQVVYSASQFLLTTISIDRCVSVLFPLWYRCHRPEYLSTVLCALVWILCALVNGTCTVLQQTLPGSFARSPPIFYVFLVNAMVCLPLITVSTLILFIRFCFKSQQLQRGKLLVAILLTLFFYLIFAFPLNVIFLITFHSMSSYYDYDNIVRYSLCEYALLCASLNSFINPLIYFLVGREKRVLCKENMKLILQRVFKEEEEGKWESLEQANVMSA